jgi:nucleotide-binding universal stress UspA family protein
MSNEFTWLVGIDLGPRSGGALQFARMLRQRIHAHVVGVYVAELWQFGVASGEGTAWTPGMRAGAEQWLAARNTGTPDAAIDAARILEAVDAESGLTEAASGAAGVVVGRRPAHPAPWSRLGRVARRLLRRLPAPVIVVPPELAADEFAGPVLLATDLSDRSVPAAELATKFARALGRPLSCVHVGQPRWGESHRLLEPRKDELRATYREAVEQATRVWASKHCPEAAPVFEYGDPVERLVALVEHMHPSLLVVGSGRPGMVERIFTGSTASAVAALAPCAVAVVPPDAKQV